MPPRNVRAKSDAYRRSGDLIARRRAELNLTQQQLAEKLGVRRQNVQHWEKGAAMPRPAIMQKLARELKLTVDEINRGQLALGIRDQASAQQDLELTPNARTVARVWDDLPQAGQDYIAEQLAAMLRFQNEDRDMAAHVFSKPSTETMKRLREHEKLLELAQNRSRRHKVKPPEDE